MTTTILIPGLLCDDVVWRPVVDRLDGDAIVTRYPDRDSLTDMAQDCLDQHGGPLAVLGHSMGARIAMEMAHLEPTRVERLGLYDTGTHPLADGELEKRNEIVQFANENGMAALADRWLPGMIFGPHRENPEIMGALRDMVMRMDPDLHARQINALINRPDATAYLSGIKCPVLLLVGRHDAWSKVSQHEDMLNMLPNARLEIIENAGHFAPVEEPEIVSRISVDFLSEAKET